MAHFTRIFTRSIRRRLISMWLRNWDLSHPRDYIWSSASTDSTATRPIFVWSKLILNWSSPAQTWISSCPSAIRYKLCIFKMRLARGSSNHIFGFTSSGWNFQYVRHHDRPACFWNLLLPRRQQSQSKANKFRRPFARHHHHTICSSSTADATSFAKTPHVPFALWPSSGHPLQLFRIGQYG